MLLLDATNLCTDLSPMLKLLGWVVTIIKIVIPLILIVLGMVDLGKAVVSSEDKAINKSVTKLIQRFIAAVVIFFIPAIVNAIFSAIGVMSGSEQSQFTCAVKCITNVSSCPTSELEPGNN